MGTLGFLPARYRHDRSVSDPVFSLLLVDLLFTGTTTGPGTSPSLVGSPSSGRVEREMSLRIFPFLGSGRVPTSHLGRPSVPFPDHTRVVRVLHLSRLTLVSSAPTTRRPNSRGRGCACPSAQGVVDPSYPGLRRRLSHQGERGDCRRDWVEVSDRRSPDGVRV